MADLRARIESALSACLKNRFASTGDSPGTCLAVLRGGVPVCCRRLAGETPAGRPRYLFRCWAGLSIPKSRRPGEDVAVVGLNFDLLAGRDVFLATDD